MIIIIDLSFVLLLDVIDRVCYFFLGYFRFLRFSLVLIWYQLCDYSVRFFRFLVILFRVLYFSIQDGLGQVGDWGEEEGRFFVRFCVRSWDYKEKLQLVCFGEVKEFGSVVQKVGYLSFIYQGDIVEKVKSSEVFFILLESYGGVVGVWGDKEIMSIFCISLFCDFFFFVVEGIYLWLRGLC